MYKISYDADGTTTEYMFSFPFFQNADVCVAVDNQNLSPEKYAVIANDDFTGGTVILLDAPDAGIRIDIFRHISLSRVIDYQPIAEPDPEDLNDDFNFLLEALRDRNEPETNLAEWANTHDNVLQFLQYNMQLVQDKLSGGGVMGLYNNLLSVLGGALPRLINDYGYITDATDVTISDDYGVL
ncbi:MAG: hypothetical protein K2M34_03465 [Alphaproteobacteria bacterium]|nr:hypothetical protein [Alphaproteobacteria bacterium]